MRLFRYTWWGSTPPDYCATSNPDLEQLWFPRSVACGAFLSVRWRPPSPRSETRESLTQNFARLRSAYEDAAAGMEKERLSGFHSQLECEAVGGTDAAKRSPVMDSLVFCWLEDPVVEAANTFSCARGISLSRYRGWILWNHAPELRFDHPWCYWVSSGVPDFKCLRLHPECT